jgi:pullulanase
VIAIMRWLLVAGVLAMGPAVWATDAACDSPPFETILHAVPENAKEPVEARAIWLNHSLIAWPKTEAGGTFKLYHSAKGRIVARKGERVSGADGALNLDMFKGEVPRADAERFKYVAKGVTLAVRAADAASLVALHKKQLVLVRQDVTGNVIDATATQSPGALDDIYRGAAQEPELGVTVTSRKSAFKLWAPTASRVAVCIYETGKSKARESHALRWNASTGAWTLSLPRDLSGKYYVYLVDVFVPGKGVVRNRVTDPYSISLAADSVRSYVGNLDAPSLKPAGWDASAPPNTVQAQTDMTIYELHVRDFSANDASVESKLRGKYLAFEQTASDGMRHLRTLAEAGMTDVHLLPVFDFATVPEQGCATLKIPSTAAADSDEQQTAAMAGAAQDCFNWGYDPFHFNAPEGSYATDASDGAARILEFRRMVMALNRAGLRVGMDVVYNHMTASGQHPKSVLDRIVPGYYHRLDADGKVERSTCCDNTATEHLMMGKLMKDSVVLWAKHYKISSFRFDLMGHQPRDAMLVLKREAEKAVGREVQLLGEGWNFGEVANGSRFVQASQLSLNVTGIATFSDRARDAARGGGHGDGGERMVLHQGYLNGLFYDSNALASGKHSRADLLKAADMMRVGLAGSLRDFELTTADGSRRRLADVDYNGQPAGYVSRPDEVVNYVENHDNQTFFDIGSFRLPAETSLEDRARVQALGAAVAAFSQGIAYFHAGFDLMRSKSLDANSYDSGDWFNRIDWRAQENYFGTGLPPKTDNEAQYAVMKPLLADARIKPSAKEIGWSRDAFRDLLRIRASSTLFRMRTADDVKARLRFLNTGPAQIPTVLAAHLHGEGYSGAGFKQLAYFVNVDKVAHELTVESEKGKAYRLHPVHLGDKAADRRPKEQARYEARNGRFSIPARTAVVFVID